jgi:hypothetical protein
LTDLAPGRLERAAPLTSRLARAAPHPLRRLLAWLGGDAAPPAGPGAAYLRRREDRRLAHELRRLTVLGLLLGGLLSGFGFWNAYLAPARVEVAWHVMLWLGLAVVLLTLVVPQLLAPVERGMRWVGSTLGGALLHGALAAVYALVIVPVGVALRWVRGPAPICSWTTAPRRAGAEGWRPKLLAVPAREEGPPRRVGLGAVLRFFVRHGGIVFLPAVIVLAAFGIALYFVKTSALAPFIYTLF